MVGKEGEMTSLQLILGCLFLSLISFWTTFPFMVSLFATVRTVSVEFWSIRVSLLIIVVCLSWLLVIGRISRWMGGESLLAGYVVGIEIISGWTFWFLPRLPLAFLLLRAHAGSGWAIFRQGTLPRTRRLDPRTIVWRFFLKSAKIWKVFFLWILD